MKVQLEEAKNRGLTLEGLSIAVKESTSEPLAEEEPVAPHEAYFGCRAWTLTKPRTPSIAEWDPHARCHIPLPDSCVAGERAGATTSKGIRGMLMSIRSCAQRTLATVSHMCTVLTVSLRSPPTQQQRLRVGRCNTDIGREGPQDRQEESRGPAVG